MTFCFRDDLHFICDADGCCEADDGCYDADDGSCEADDGCCEADDGSCADDDGCCEPDDVVTLMTASHYLGPKKQSHLRHYEFPMNVSLSGMCLTWSHILVGMQQWRKRQLHVAHKQL
ncbi:hypothetical protein OS493_000763 [Desmophyllum pertusum]|uniref:Uncharacterized protein n=1 Tax=Desmophyllum pertusum TaxID=174260 RepID=A0A9X0A7N0_9CNID|nr:hypothetical protein OS493_000763 [Desmophyllum pertusum]